jgi:hypothetical protein
MPPPTAFAAVADVGSIVMMSVSILTKPAPPSPLPPIETPAFHWIARSVCQNFTISGAFPAELHFSGNIHLPTWGGYDTYTLLKELHSAAVRCSVR